MLAKALQPRLQKYCDTVKHFFFSVVNNVSNETLDKAEQFYKENNEIIKCGEPTTMPEHTVKQWLEKLKAKVAKKLREFIFLNIQETKDDKCLSNPPKQ